MSFVLKGEDRVGHAAVAQAAPLGATSEWIWIDVPLKSLAAPIRVVQACGTVCARASDRRCSPPRSARLRLAQIFPTAFAAG